MFWPLLDVHNPFCVAGAMDAALLQVWGFSNIFKNDDKRGAFEENLHRCISRGRRSARVSPSGMLAGQGADFLRRVAFWSIRSSVLVRWFCMTGAALRKTWRHCFVACAVLSRDRMGKSQNAMARRRQPCTQPCHFWRKSRRIASFLNLSTSQNEEVSQNFVLFDVVKF